MNSRWYGIIALVLVALLSIIYSVYMESKSAREYNKKLKIEQEEGQFEELEEEYESFNNNIQENNIIDCNFMNGKNCKDFNNSEGINEIIPYNNPGDSSNVLRQSFSNSKETYYGLKLKLNTNSLYKISCLYSSKSNPDLIHVVTFENGYKYVLSTKKGERIGNLPFFEYTTYFKTPELGNIGTLMANIYISYAKGSFNDYKYITNIKLNKVIENKNIPVTTNLTVYLNNSCNDQNSILWKDSSKNGNDFEWSDFDKKILYGPSGKKIQNSCNQESNYIMDNNNFTFFIYLAKEDKKYTHEETNNYIDLINIPGNQTSSLILKIPNEYGQIIFIIDGKEYKTERSYLTSISRVYSVSYNGKEINLYFDGVRVYKFKSPKLYFNAEKIKLQNKIINKESNLSINSFVYYNENLSKNNINKISDFLKKESINSSNCFMHMDVDDFLSNDNLLINMENEVENMMEQNDFIENNNPVNYVENNRKENNCPEIVYKNKSYHLLPNSSDKSSSFVNSGVKNYGNNRENAKYIYSLNFPNCPIPDILDEKKYKPDYKNCPFIIQNDNPCEYYECKDIKWNENEQKFNDQCKLRIDHYCSLNSEYDPSCFCWRPENRDKKQCQKWRGKFESTDKCDFRKQNIESHPDFDKYIRKDKIPCWNCNLNTPGIDQSLEEKNRVFKD